ncbi:MAG: hypothetical protein KDN22_23550 [Verrucomicrobiae bacterium]|nr:hypothetical protein [Verrucomicrobiae bacterium]
MKAHEMFLQMSPALAVELVDFFYHADRNVYKTTISTLATQRKLRPVFVTKKSRDQQFQWVVKALQTKRSDEIAQHLLQAWLMKAKSDMLVAFLDKQEIEHDGTGAVDELPKTLDPEKLKAAIDTLLGKYSAEEVTLYLHMFQLQEEGGWPELAAELEKDDRLQLGTATKAPEAAPASAAAAEEPAAADETKADPPAAE